MGVCDFIYIETKQIMCYNQPHIESGSKGFNHKRTKELSLGKPGENPGRTRRCEWERKPHNVTVL